MNIRMFNAFAANRDDKELFDKKDWDDWVKRSLNTRDAKKIKAMLDDLIRNESFLNQVRDIRKFLGIPIAGYAPETHNEKEIPRLQIAANSLDLCEKFGLNKFYWQDSLFHFIAFNQLSTPDPMAGPGGLIFIQDVLEDLEDPFSLKVQKEDAKHYPIALRLHPSVSQRDIIDFIKTHYTTSIQPMLKQHQKGVISIRAKRSRSKLKQQMADFIYKHKDLAHKQIARMLYIEFKGKAKPNTIPDYGAVAKILSLETKRRNRKLSVRR